MTYRFHERLFLVAFLLVSGCSPKKETAVSETNTTAIPEDRLTKVTELGPVKVTVWLSPSSPVVGDTLHLGVDIESPNGIILTLPEYGDALDRFSIKESRKESSNLRYSLQSPMSGNHRIPQIRILFNDNRKKATASVEPTELLTDELAFVVTSASLADQQELTPAPGELRVHSTYFRWQFLLIGGLVLSILLGLFLFIRSRTQEKQLFVDPYNFATTRLSRIESSGLPDPEESEYWYVDLSEVIRKYIELRFELKAPDQTTEEFLATANQKGVLAPEHQRLLSTFLSHADQVKFARHRPSAEESNRALELAWKFVRETKPQEATHV